MAAWAFVGQDYLDLKYVLIFSFLWCILGDMSWYLLSYFYGKKLLFRVGFGKIIDSSQFLKLETYFQNNSIKTILLSRFLITGLGSSVNILSWLTKIQYKKFFLLDLIGESIYVAFFVYLWYFLGNQWQYITPVLENFLTILLLITLLYVVFMFMFRKEKK